MLTVSMYKPSLLVKQFRDSVLELLYHEAIDHLESGVNLEACAGRGCQICINGLAAMKEAASRRRY